MRHNELKSRGFTLVELLVVIAIIGVLIALLLPAVQAARESARRTQCQNNLKQLGVALQDYHAANQTFPPSARFDDKGRSPDYATTHLENWVITTLPFIEQQTLHASFNLKRPISDAVNRIPRGVDISAMICPSDTGHLVKFEAPAEGDNWARGNYGANGGLGAYATDWLPTRSGAGPNSPAWNNPLTGGVMGANVARSIGQIVDGTTHTILLAELRVGLAAIDRRGTWALAGPGASSVWMHGSDDAYSPNQCGEASDNIMHCMAIEAAVGPGTMESTCMTCCRSCISNTQAAPRSAHAGGVFVAMGDASVHFILDTIDSASPWEILDPKQLATWQRLNSAIDEQVVDESWY